MERGAWRTAAAVRFPNGRWELTLSRALYRRREGRSEFALPYSPVCPWSLPELFCFARVEEIDEKPYIIYAFDENKTPIF